MRNLIIIDSKAKKTMHSKKILFTPFSRARYSESSCLRPNDERELCEYLAKKPQNLLARGAGLSYSDSCLNKDGYMINTNRFNHLIEFNSDSGLVICQGGVTFKDLFLLHPEFIPPVLPGTVHATVAGGVAHDVHGKNNHQGGSFGHHIVWLELLLNGEPVRCSPEEHSDLFYATIAGLGLTGLIIRVSIRLKKASRFVQVENKQINSLQELTELMLNPGLNNEYQVAWLDLLNSRPRAILSFANHCETAPDKKQRAFIAPKVPFCLPRSWNLKLLNQFLFSIKETKKQLSLQQFNNPLDKIKHWNRLYGPKGLCQFQAVFSLKNAHKTLEELLQLIKNHKATPGLAVLKLFTQSGEGLLSFCKPGFTLAIDFINNEQAKQAIFAMNQYITDSGGQVYLAKDLFLTSEQFKKMYPRQDELNAVLSQYQCTFRSDMSQRLGITR